MCSLFDTQICMAKPRPNRQMAHTLFLTKQVITLYEPGVRQSESDISYGRIEAWLGLARAYSRVHLTSTRVRISKNPKNVLSKTTVKMRLRHSALTTVSAREESPWVSLTHVTAVEAVCRDLILTVLKIVVFATYFPVKLLVCCLIKSSLRRTEWILHPCFICLNFIMNGPRKWTIGTNPHLDAQPPLHYHLTTWSQQLSQQSKAHFISSQHLSTNKVREYSIVIELFSYRPSHWQFLNAHRTRMTKYPRHRMLWVLVDFRNFFKKMFGWRRNTYWNQLIDRGPQILLLFRESRL